MKKSVVYTIIIVLVVLLVTLGGLAYYQYSQMNELVEQMEIEKSELQEEYEDLAIQFDGYQNLDIKNDSLQDLLSREQQRVQDLLEELRQTKVTSARRIAELKKELATVREVMKDYVPGGFDDVLRIHVRGHPLAAGIVVERHAWMGPRRFWHLRSR